MTDTQAVAAESPQVPTPLAAALDYAELGWRVMPLHAPVATGCSCGQRACRTVGKHPRIKDWRENATNDFEQIKEWFGRWPEANVGLVTGEYFDVIDIDGPDGVNSIATVLSGADKALMRDTYHVRTGREESSWHYYVAPTGLRQGAGLLPGVDLRSVGGLVVAPPSVHNSGRKYMPVTTSSRTRILAAPASLLEAFEAAKAPRPVLRPVPTAQATRAAQRPTSTSVGGKQIKNVESYTKTTTERLVSELAAAPAHTGNDALNKTAFRMFHFVEAGLITSGEATSMLVSAMVQRGRPFAEHEVMATIRSGAAAAAAQPDYDLIEAAREAQSRPAPSPKRARPTPAATEAATAPVAKAPEVAATEAPQVGAPAADATAVAEAATQAPAAAVTSAPAVTAPEAVEVAVGVTPAPVAQEAAQPARPPQRRLVPQPKSMWGSELDRIFANVPDSTVRPYDLVLGILTLCAADLAATGMSPEAAASRMLSALEAQAEPWYRLMANATALARGAPPAGGVEVLRSALTSKIREAVVAPGDATEHFDAASDRLSALAALRPANLGRPELATSLAALAGTSEVALVPASGAAPIFVVAPSFARTPTAVFETVARATGFSTDLEFAIIELTLEQNGVRERFLEAVQTHTGNNWATCVRTLSHTECSDVMAEAMRSFDPKFPRIRKPMTFTPEQRERASYTLANKMIATLDTPRPVAIEWSAGSDADQQAARERVKRYGLVVHEAVRVPVTTLDATGETAEIDVLYAPELPPGFVATVGGHATPEAKAMADRLYAAVSAAGLPWPHGAIEARIPALENLQLAELDVAVAGGFLAATGAWDNPHAPLVGRCATDATVVLPDGQETTLLEALAGQSLVEDEFEVDEAPRKASAAYLQSEDYRYVTGLFAQLRGDDEQAAKHAQVALVRRLDPIIGSILAKRNLSPRDQDYLDARQAAYEASLGVMSRFDPEAGAQFTSYAYRRINGAVLNYLSRDRGDLWPSYEHEDHRIPAKSLNTNATDAQDDDGQTLEERLIAPGADPSDEAAERLARPLLAKLMSACTEEERTVLELHHGLDGSQPLTYDEVGERLGRSKESVRSLELKAVAKMRDQSSAVGVTERSGVAPPTVEDLAEAARRLRRQARVSGAGKMSAQTAATLIVAQTRERYPSYIASLEDASEQGLVPQICQMTGRPQPAAEAADQGVQSESEDATDQRPVPVPPPPPPAQAGPPVQAAWC